MTTTTSLFQKKSDYYNSKKESIESLKVKFQTNPRYKNFKQTHFTVGDEEQFNEYRYEKNGNNEEDIFMFNNLFCHKNYNIWEGYHKLETISVINTFRYIFNKFKKGIFIKILNNELKVFLPFSNASFVNEWSHKIKIPSYNIFRYISGIDERNFNEKSVNDFKNTWYANNCLLRYEYPINEGDTNVSNIKNMLEELCKQRNIPDIEFFLNRRDFPILTKNYTEPYYDLWDSMYQPLVSHKYDKYLPILSMSKTDYFADILIPTHEDWARVQCIENKWFSKSYRGCNEECNEKVCWDDKKNIAVFRGSSTGSGITIETNQRLKIAYLSYLKKIDEDDNLPYLDAGITKWNMRLKKISNETELKVLDIKSLPFTLIPFLTYSEQSKYKYIIHIDGHVSAFRLSSELGIINSVVLLVESKWKLWYSDLLKPYVHYIPIKKDLSDIYKQIKWCKLNDDKCKQISLNANKFYETYLQKNGILDYMQKLIFDIKSQIGTYHYNEISPLSIQSNTEIEIIKKIMSQYPSSSSLILNSFPTNNRCYGFLKGIQYIINLFSSLNKLDNILIKNDDIFKNSSVEIEKYQINDFNIILKSLINYKKLMENIHETFIGLSCINEIIRKIPNFSYIFGIDNKNRLITEYIHGETLLEYIKSDKFDLNEFFFILSQICLALQVAQDYCCFVHYDLTPWNIIIQKLDTEVDVDYIIDNKIITIKTKIIPIIIDYGKSHVVYDYEHYSFVMMYKFSTCQDIISILLTSIYQILTDKNISKIEFTNLLKLSNFITNTKYRKQPFNNSRDLKSFLRYSKKYSNLLYNNKYELENIKPIDLFKFLDNKFKILYKTKENYDNFYMDKCNGEQFFLYTLSSNREGQLDSYIKTIEKYNNFINKEKIWKKLHEINILSNNLLKFCSTVEEKEKYSNIIKKINNNIIIDDNIDIEEYNNKFEFSSYNENIYIENKKLLKLLNDTTKYDINKMITYCNQVDNNLDILLYKKYYYTKKIKINLSSSSKIKNQIANINTLINTTKKILKFNNNNREIYEEIYNFLYKVV